MAYSGAIADTLREIFSASGILANFEDKNGVGVFSVRMKLRCRMQSAQMIVLVREESFSTITTLPLCADEDHRLAMAEFLARANWGMLNGNFELNMLDGEIRYKTYLQMQGDVPPAKTVDRYLSLSYLMLEKYGNGLLSVMFGVSTPEEAIKAAEGD